jgi:hypothetical protein
MYAAKNLLRVRMTHAVFAALALFNQAAFL